MINDNFFVSDRIQSLMYDIRGLGESEAYRTMKSQVLASNRAWGEFTVAILLSDLFKMLNVPRVLIVCDDGGIYPFEELFLSD